MRRSSGFATAAVLLLVGVIAATALWSASEALTTRAMGTARQLQLRAVALTEGALTAARRMVSVDPLAGTASWHWQSDLVAEENARAQSRRTFTHRLPTGFSAGRFAGYQHEISATGSSSRGAAAMRTLGITVIYPAEPVL
jgi:hypothetical protein